MPCGRLPLVKHKLLLEISNYKTYFESELYEPIMD